jgi:kynurenine 3-monooxygenase
MVVHDAKEGKDINVTFDFCIGADGSYSVVRRQMMRVVRFVPFSPILPPQLCLIFFVPTPHHQFWDNTSMDYQQEYISHEYIELKMPSGLDEVGNPSFLLDPNYLHIWPRHSFMLIALPNKAATFTVHFFLSVLMSYLTGQNIYLHSIRAKSGFRRPVHSGDGLDVVQILFS